jgi:NADH:ubiquinone oxidoreductase subunit 4 (subunit M)
MVGLVTAIILIPLLGAVAVCTWPPASAEATAGRLRNGRPIALMFNIISAGCALALWRNFDATATGLQFVERHAWIPAINAEYLVGVDGLSLLLVLLTSLIIPFAFLAQPAPDGSRAFYATMLGHAVCALRHVHRTEFRSLVPVLRNESDPGFSADQNLGR